ncbi:hypothetical protein GCM10027160_29200 [Streptomyces calidiresistens]|uniref:Uncharacterized protein n=1 Tax=Streptomyces calidiresistens TaxID=1485586 RepID=A0A7W3XW59_9ACTN|nr:hypothetical protein [Streptomyces calidiresistens]MBB0229493.1 hypothetical protein [Streptomyces calidiresistens]
MPHPAADIRAALNHLPARCRYHGDDIDPPSPGRGRESCCDTGLPAVRRRAAEQALAQLSAGTSPPPEPNDGHRPPVPPTTEAPPRTRLTIDQLTSDDLDSLYDRLEDAENRARSSREPTAEPEAEDGPVLPARLLNIVHPVRPYLSGACEVAAACTTTARRHPRIAETLNERAAYLHDRCRRTHEYTGEQCLCRCHHSAPRPSEQPTADAIEGSP